MMDAFSFIKTDLAENCDLGETFAFRHRSVSFYHNLLAIASRLRTYSFSQIDTAVYPVYTYSVLS